MTAIRLVIFDLGGTLIRDDGCVMRAFTGALKQHRIAHTRSALDKVRGMSKREVLQQFLGCGPTDPAALADLYQCFCERLADEYRRHGVHAIPGAINVLDAIRRLGLAVAVTTGFDRAVFRTVAGALGWGDDVMMLWSAGTRLWPAVPPPSRSFGRWS